VLELHAQAVEMLRKSCGSISKTCGLAVISFKQPVDLDALLGKLDGQDVMGRPMIVSKSKFVEDNGSYVPLAHTTEPPRAMPPTRMAAH
jgi:hypothetical protein